MKKIALSLSVGALALAGLAAQAECVKAVAPALPDGDTASLEEMVAGQKGVKGFMEEGNAYLACLDEEGVAAGAEEAPELQAARLEDYNGVVAEQEGLQRTGRQQSPPSKHASEA